MGKGRRGYDRRILDPHPVVHFILFLQAPQDGDRILDRWLGNHHRLEPPFQGRVFFHMFAVFVDGRRPHTAQFPAGERRLQHVGSVHGALGRACPHEGVEFVNKQDDVSFPFLNFLEQGFQTVLELPPVLGAGDERP